MPATPSEDRPLSAFTPEESTTHSEQILRQAPLPARIILRGILSAQERHTLFLPGQTLVVAVSGGADSICLLHALLQLAPQWNLALHVAHLDHALRPESADDAVFVATFAQRFSLPFTTERLTPGIVDDDPAGQEGAARSARYAFLRRVATDLSDQISDQSGLPVTVVTAHHQDDQAETLLMHLIQGSGLNGLAGMAWKGALPDSQQPSIRLVRPLLAVDRAAIHDYLHSYGLEWSEDQSNHDHAHLRNQLRHQIFPLLATINPNIHATLARTADLLAAEAERADKQDQTLLAALIVNHTPSTRIVLDLFPLTQYDLATQRGVLRQALLTLGVDLRTIGMEGIDTLLEQVSRGKDTTTHPLVGMWSWTLLHNGEKRQLSIHHINASPSRITHPHVASPLAAPILIPTEGTLKVGEWQLESTLLSPDDLPADWRSRAQPWRLFCDADESGEFYLTTFQAGMAIAPLGMGGHQRSLGDIFTDHKIVLFERLNWPIIVRMDGRVAWQCGLTVSEFIRIQPTTHQVRHLCWKLEAENNQ